MPNPFAMPGVWLRCALHAHSTASDGELRPGCLVRHYERAGFDVLAITDHWIRTDEPSTEHLLVIPSTELDARLPGSARRAHVLALGVDEAPSAPDSELPTLAETAEWVLAHGGVPFLAHPYWSGLRTHELERCKGLLGVEVYNAGCELETGRGLSSVHWDELLETGRRWLAIAVDDTHHPGFDSGFAWTWVRTPERAPSGVLRALREGACYSSTGPTVDALDIERPAVEVRCSPAERVTLVTGARRGASVAAGRLGYRHNGEILEHAANGSIVAARLVGPNDAPYARLEIRDADGRTAWTNPLWP
ncbi:MAG TPA: CehA/McbA family metallohydrolase [Gaiellaceae bacterium]|nr:CehA/McbA family metallohydrolase [Gaiellaceae bacterium]